MGRTGIYELLNVSDAIKDQIHARAPEASLRAKAISEGMSLMREDGERLVSLGITSEEELIRVTRD
jgi:general secretion pathway protein E